MDIRYVCPYKAILIFIRPNPPESLPCASKITSMTKKKLCTAYLECSRRFGFVECNFSNIAIQKNRKTLVNSSRFDLVTWVFTFFDFTINFKKVTLDAEKLPKSLCNFYFNGFNGSYLLELSFCIGRA